MLWLATSMMAPAEAGVAAGVLVGAGAPLAVDSASPTPAPVLGGYAGYRVGLGPIHLQPELLLRANLADPLTASAGVGGVFTFGTPVHLGVYGHAGYNFVGYTEPVADAGLVAEITAVGPLALGLRAGWQWDRPLRYKCGDCPQPAEHWLVAGLTVGIAK